MVTLRMVSIPDPMSRRISLGGTDDLSQPLQLYGPAGREDLKRSCRVVAMKVPLPWGPLCCIF